MKTPILRTYRLDCGCPRMLSTETDRRLRGRVWCFICEAWRPDPRLHDQLRLRL